ncbi:hypothetical protein [Actinomadura nitritigenes]|uniref:hypothetical protein n=1 Tax=Actinomadura nitritigenes TaxID=134602 RepID=UPI003D93BA94
MPAGTVLAGVLVTLAFFILIGYTVRVMTRDELTAARLARTLIAIGTLVTALPTVLYALYGGS